MSDPDLEAAWAEVSDNTPEGWYLDQPMEHPERNEWAMFAFDPPETPVEGKQSREWTTMAPTALDCVRSMAYCLAELKAGRRPK